MKQIILTENEQQALLKMLDVALRQLGLNNAKAVIALAELISSAKDYDDSPKQESTALSV